MALQANAIQNGWNLASQKKSQILKAAHAIRKQAAEIYKKANEQLEKLNKCKVVILWSVCLEMARNGETLKWVDSSYAAIEAAAKAKKDAFVAKYQGKSIVVSGNTYHNRMVLGEAGLKYANREWSGVITSTKALIDLYFCKGLSIAIIGSNLPVINKAVPGVTIPCKKCGTYCYGDCEAN
jgi:hypothetical protein